MKYSIRFLCDIKTKLLKSLKDGYKPVNRHQKGVTLIPLVYTHYAASHKVCRSLIRTLHKKDIEVLRDCEVFTACRRNRNLADMLVRNKV